MQSDAFRVLCACTILHIHPVGVAVIFSQVVHPQGVVGEEFQAILVRAIGVADLLPILMDGNFQVLAEAPLNFVEDALFSGDEVGHPTAKPFHVCLVLLRPCCWESTELGY